MNSLGNQRNLKLYGKKLLYHPLLLYHPPPHLVLLINTVVRYDKAQVRKHQIFFGRPEVNQPQGLQLSHLAGSPIGEAECQGEGEAGDGDQEGTACSGYSSHPHCVASGNLPPVATM